MAIFFVTGDNTPFLTSSKEALKIIRVQKYFFHPLVWQQQGSVPSFHLFMAPRLCSIECWFSPSTTEGWTSSPVWEIHSKFPMCWTANKVSSKSLVRQELQNQEILCCFQTEIWNSVKLINKNPYPLTSHHMCLLDFSRKGKMVPEDSFIIWVRAAVKQ